VGESLRHRIYLTMAKPILTLTTDFGLTDHFVGVMKGVILDICPLAQIVDISHEIAPFAIAQGAYLIAQAYPYFSKNTVHIVVVDPGVGGARRPILVEAAGQYFVAPDNGVLEIIYSREKHQVWAITDARVFRQPVSQTFHGRDVFAPAAAHLACGANPAKLGKKIIDYAQSPFATPRPARPQPLVRLRAAHRPFRKPCDQPPGERFSRLEAFHDQDRRQARYHVWQNIYGGPSGRVVCHHRKHGLPGDFC
jgi:S-adenosyl-l-methionine hydroxide adenosyltransferase